MKVISSESDELKFPCLVPTVGTVPLSELSPNTRPCSNGMRHISVGMVPVTLLPSSIEIVRNVDRYPISEGISQWH